MAKFCGNCGTKLLDTAAFCSGCGTRVAAAPLAATAPPPAATAPPPTAAPYTPVTPSYTPVSPAFEPPPSISGETAYKPVTSSYETTSQTFEPVAPAVESTYSPVTPSYENVPQTFTPPPSAIDSAYTPVTPPAYPPATPPVDPTPAPAQAVFTPVAASYPPAPPAYQPAQAYQPVGQQAYPAAQPPYAPGTAYPAAKKSNTLLKVIIAFILILFIGGALALAGLWYAAQKIKEKAHAAATQAMNGGAVPGSMGELLNSVSGNHGDDSGATAFKGDPCRFLSKEEVGTAIGTPVLRAEAQDGGCNYIAHGDAGDAAAKHMSAMLGGMGVDSKTQKSIQKLAGGMFAQQQADDKTLAADAATGEIPVLVVSFSAGNATAEMRRNRKALQFLNHNAGTASSSATGDLAGIGDEAYVAGGSMIVLRKGNTAAHLLYVSCPCNTENVAPLAKLIASRL